MVYISVKGLDYRRTKLCLR